MATDIIGSLFGVNPAAYQQAQQKQGYTQDLQAVQLDPLQQANLALRQGGRGLGQFAGGLMGMQDPELAKASQIKQLSTQFNLADPQGLRDFGNAIKEFAPQEAMQAIAAADEREKSSLGIRKTKADIEKAELSVAQEEKLRAELSALGPNPSEQAVIGVVSKYGSPDKILQVLTSSQDRAAARAVAASNKAAAQGPLGPLTPAQKALDTSFGKDYAAFINKGGQSLIDTQIGNLDTAINALETKSNITGKAVGLADKTGTLSYVNSDAQEVKDLVGKIVQSDLRQVLGGQFAQKEGEQLLARSYNPAQPQADNLKRLKSLRQQMADAAAQKINAVNYFEANGSLKGFRGLETPKTEQPATATKKKTRKLASGVEVTVEE